MNKKIKKIGHSIETTIINPTVAVVATAYKIAEDVCNDLTSGAAWFINAEEKSIKKIIEK